jgi:hypothetical protein
MKRFLIRKAGNQEGLILAFFSCFPNKKPWNEGAIGSVMDDLLRGGGFLRQVGAAYLRRSIYQIDPIIL